MTIGVKSSERTLLLFELFSRKQQPLTIADISEGIDVPQSSTSALVSSLVRQGYLEQDARQRTYYPTLRISLLGTWMRRQHRRAGQLPALLSEISKRTGESSILSMRNGIYSQYLLAQRGNDPKRAHVESGMLYPLACSSTGWCLLSLESADGIGKIVRRTIAETSNDRWRETATSAHERVQETRRRGYAISNGEVIEGLGAISILLPSMPGAQAMAAGVGGRTERIQAKTDIILEALYGLSDAIRKLSDQSEQAVLE